MRLIQGFSLGGEFTGSMVYTTELASPMMRGLVSSSTAAGTTLGFILGSATAWLVNVALERRASASVGLADSVHRERRRSASPAGCLRRGIHETAEGVKAAAIRPPLVPSLLADWLPIVRTFGIVAMTNAAYYLTFTYAVERRKSLTGEGGEAFLLANTLSLLVVLVVEAVRRLAVGPRRPPAADDGADGRDDGPDLHRAAPDALRLARGSSSAGQLLLAVPIGMALGLQGAMVVEIFPLRTRVTSMSFAYSITLALAGGHRAAGLHVADRDARPSARAGVLHHAVRRDRPRP